MERNQYSKTNKWWVPYFFFLLSSLGLVSRHPKFWNIAMGMAKRKSLSNQRKEMKYPRRMQRMGEISCFSFLPCLCRAPVPKLLSPWAAGCISSWASWCALKGDPVVGDVWQHRKTGSQAFLPGGSGKGTPGAKECCRDFGQERT